MSSGGPASPARTSALGARSADELATLLNGSEVAMGGLVICRQAPPTAKGHVFLTLEDETGLANVVIRPQVYVPVRTLVRS